MKLSTKDRKKFRVRNNLKKFSSPDRLRLSIFRSANCSEKKLKFVFSLIREEQLKKKIKTNKKICLIGVFKVFV